jgi:hypothetical protein
LERADRGKLRHVRQSFFRHYRFLVRAINADNAESQQPAVVTFTVLRPVWQRWWFLLLAALAISGRFTRFTVTVSNKSSNSNACEPELQPICTTTSVLRFEDCDFV